MAEETLILIKPDGVQRGLIGEVISRIEHKGLRVHGLKMLQMDAAMARQHYAEHVDKPFFDSLSGFITSAPLVAMVAQGPDAVAHVRNLVGATDPKDSPPGSIRGDYGLTIGMNIIHASDSPERAKREVALFFRPEEVLDYTREVERWILEEA
ncbi:MAG: nucleoside-diphosphate kinase [Candidatus Dormibacteraeota bacterium]|nr:nucleoside-diphosphate kinase [Candidatus Dormibacteraeota bacterium]